MRLLVVILVAMLVGLSLQSNHSSRYLVEAVLSNYVLKDYGVEEKLALLVENTRSRMTNKEVPVFTESEMQSPCSYLTVARRYGWNWNEQSRKQEFYPGITLIVKENTPVRPILSGEVVEVSRQEEGRTILIKHGEKLFSYYQGLQEVLVRENQMVNQNEILGKTGKTLYFELRDEDGPMDPHSLFP
ncbi:MAG TPA: M23 family metallopeptidase [Syntrophomonadaceae bacterium]|nr:M23 family metallopeptidase [Syntrophomonadaceae bacterium]HQE22896.1 M23 family metallopeptidase [Syntrophomonadaceae bacterium]